MTTPSLPGTRRGRVYLLRTCGPDGQSRGDYRWPMAVGAVATAPDWNPEPVCGGGLHGLPGAEGDAQYLATDGVALVISAARRDVVAIDAEKAKCRRARIEYVAAAAGVAGLRDAVTWMVALGVADASRAVYATVSGGDYATVSGGYGARVSGGNDATVSGGDYATVSGGDDARVSGGNGATVSGGDYATVSGGYGARVSGGYGATVSGGHHATVSGGDRAVVSGDDYAVVSGGYGATVSGGHGATLSVLWYDVASYYYRVAVGYVGEGGILPGRPYRVEGGVLVPAATVTP